MQRKAGRQCGPVALKASGVGLGRRRRTTWGTIALVGATSTCWHFRRQGKKAFVRAVPGSTWATRPGSTIAHQTASIWVGGWLDTTPASPLQLAVDPVSVAAAFHPARRPLAREWHALVGLRLGIVTRFGAERDGGLRGTPLSTADHSRSGPLESVGHRAGATKPAHRPAEAAARPGARKRMKPPALQGRSPKPGICSAHTERVGWPSLKAAGNTNGPLAISLPSRASGAYATAARKNRWAAPRWPRPR